MARKATARERLDPYRRKRDFEVTPEPAGSDPPAQDGHRFPPAQDGHRFPPSQDGHRFVVQRHRARSLHYDLRLEIAGVLVSWAVPKGPTLDPAARRLAVHVEDHPLDYFDFEGVIPAGEYGGGDVIVWDWGTWQPGKEGDPLASIDRGDLHFDLSGEKLAGRFVLVRRGDAKEWMLLHKKDSFAVAGWDPEDHPRSVKSGRTNDEVAADPDATWHSDRDRESWPAPTTQELAALDALGRSGRWDLHGRTLELTDLDGVLFPGREGAPPLTKRDLIRYDASVAPAMLPYLVDRPVHLHRFPRGIGERGAWLKAAPRRAPAWLRRWRDGEPPGATEHLVMDSPAALAWAANDGALEVSPWTSRVPNLHEPTWATIDIAGGEEADIEDVLVLARLFHAALDHLGLQGLPLATGERGVQIWVPVAAGHRFEDTRHWAETLAQAVGRTVPDLVSGSRRGDGRTHLDATGNALGRTLVTPFGVRPAPGAPVSVPLRWDELDAPDRRLDRWTILTLPERLRRVGDPMAALIGLPQRLPPLSIGEPATVTRTPARPREGGQRP